MNQRKEQQSNRRHNRCELEDPYTKDGAMAERQSQRINEEDPGRLVIPAITIGNVAVQDARSNVQKDTRIPSWIWRPHRAFAQHCEYEERSE